MVRYLIKEYKCSSEVFLQKDKAHTATEIADLYVNLSEHCEGKIPIELYFIIKKECREFSMHQIFKAIQFKNHTSNFRLIVLACGKGSVKTDLIPELDKLNQRLAPSGIKIEILDSNKLAKIACVSR